MLYVGHVMLLAGESAVYIDTHVADVNTRWQSLTDLMQTTNTKLRLASDSKRFYHDFDSLREIVTSYEAWIDAQRQQQVPAELLEICRQQEQCRVRERVL